MDNITKVAEAYGFGKSLIDEMTAAGEVITPDIYKKQLELANTLIDHFMKEA